MATLSAQLSSQLLKYLRKHPDVTQKSVAEYLNLSPSFLSEIISGKKNFNGPAAMRLSQWLEKPAGKKDPTVQQYEYKGKKLSSKIVHMQLADNPGWYPSTDGSGGQDPNDRTGIDNTPDADTASPIWNQDLIDTLRETRGYHRQAIRAINKYINQAKVNAGITVSSGVAQKFSANKTLKALHKNVSARVLSAEDQAILLDHDLDKLRALRSSGDDSELVLSNAEKQKAIKREAAELQARRVALKKKYAK